MALNVGFDRLIANTDSFSDWLNKTNEIIDLVREDIITANSTIANTTGSARIIGEFSANNLYAEVISGGDIESVNDLTIVSNTLFSNSSIDVEVDVTVGNNLIYIIKPINLNNLIPANTNVYSIGNTSNRWDLFSRNINTSNSATVANNLSVSANTTTLNINVTNNAVFGNTLNVTGNLIVDSTVLFVDTVTDRVGINTATPISSFQVLGLLTSNGVTSNGALSVTGTGTITGNLTIDTNTLFVDSVLDRVGIGTLTPSTKLHVNGAITANGLISNGAVTVANTLTVNGTTNTNGILNVTANAAFAQNVTIANTLTVTGIATFDSGLDLSGDLTIDNITVTGTANIAALEVGGLVANGVAMVGTSAAVSANTITTIDSFDKSVSRGLKYIIQGNNADTTSAYTVEIMCAHNNTTAFYTRYAEVKNNFNVTIEPIVSANNVLLRVTCPSASVSNTHHFNIMRLETR
jgi:hypothetical protein